MKRRPDSLHDEVLERMNMIHGKLEAAMDISPTTLALKTHEYFKRNKDIELHIEYASLEHLKQMARGILSRTHDPVKRLSHEYDTTGEMFADLLQERYPIPHRGLNEPIYRLRKYCSDADLQYNIIRLRKTGGAYLQHADALQAYMETRSSGEAA